MECVQDDNTGRSHLLAPASRFSKHSRPCGVDSDWDGLAPESNATTERERDEV